MKKTFKKTTSIYLLLLFLFILSVQGTALAAESWYWTQLKPIGQTGRENVGNFSSKEACLAALKSVHPSYEPSTECYLAGSVKINSFSPLEGKYEEIITISGSNFIDVQEVLLGSTKLEILSVNSSSIRAKIPIGTTSGKITVVTKNGGQAISTVTFNISSNASDLRWWFKNNASNEIRGPYLSENECNLERAKFKSNYTSISLGVCFENTISNVEKDREASNYQNVTPQKTKGLGAVSDVYKPLAPLTADQKANGIVINNIGKYFNSIFEIAIGLCAALAVIMIVVFGIQYMGTESVFGKTEAKKRIFSAILGLIIALGSYALLNTINPDLLGTGIKIRGVKIEGDSNVNTVVNNGVTGGNANLTSLGITCNNSGGFSAIPSIARSFDDKMTYVMGAKGTVGPNNTVNFDCSGFVNAVLSCAGLGGKVSGGTINIFSDHGTRVTSKSSDLTIINGIPLQVGDLIGWIAGDNGEDYGHVMIYLGGGRFADSHGGSGKQPGNAYGEFSGSNYFRRVTYVVRTSTL